MSFSPTTKLVFGFSFLSPDSVQPRPLAVCAFDSHTCGWSNDLNNWQHRWTIDKSDHTLCLSSKPSQPTAGPEEDSGTYSWLPQSALRKKAKPKKMTDIQARLWSPPLPAELNLRCLHFVYKISTGTPQSGKPIGLSLLQRQEG